MYSKGTIFFTSMVWLVLAPMVVAGEFKVSGALNQTLEYDNNISLQEDKVAVSGYLMKPSVNAYWNTSSTQVSLSARGDIRRYDVKEWDCETFSLSSNQQYTHHTHVFSFASNYARSCSYSDQVSDTGILQTDNESQTYSLGPTWSWQWSSLDQLSLSSSYSKMSYTNAGSGDGSDLNNVNFQGNESYSINLSENHMWTRRFSSSISSFFSSTIFGDSGETSKQQTFGFQASNTYSITRMWSINLGGGLQWLEQPSGSDGNDSINRTDIINLSLNYTGQLTDFSLSYSRTVVPSAIGQLIENNDFSLDYSYKFSRKLSLNIASSLAKNKTIGEGDFQINSDRSFYTGTIGVRWDFDKEWQLSASYRHRRQEYTSLGSTTVVNEQDDVFSSNAIMVHLNYNWDGMRIYR